MVGAVHVVVFPFICPLLAPIGTSISKPLNVAIAPLLSALPQVKVKLAAATSVAVAIFHHSSMVEAGVVSHMPISCHGGDADGGVISVVLVLAIWASIRSPTANPVGFGMTQLVPVAPGLAEYSMNWTAILRSHYGHGGMF